MSRTHILAGEGNVGYTDLIGSPLISVVIETTKYSAVGTGKCLYLLNLTASMKTKQLMLPGT